MVGSKEVAWTIGDLLDSIALTQSLSLSTSTTNNQSTNDVNSRVWIVLDPVMISTSGHSLIQESARQALIDNVFSKVHLLTPNKLEAEALLGRKLQSRQDVGQGARDLLKMGIQTVYIKGCHQFGSAQQDTASA
jgi:hydroxymethylpyrimidine/phosphomethylpyrimidine kinase